ncbi:MAG: transporter substrate-binding domain-containing protein [Clostridia bacterium]|nr:transporter substrate-binding domain-containing protein [Clostridia bacterium]
MKKLLSIILSFTMLLSMGTVAFAEETTTSGAREVKGIIKVGTSADFPPFEYMENDKMLGFDIDLMNYIAARIGYGVEFVNMSFDKLIPAVVNGEVDCAISAITATDERESVVDFTRPYLAANVTYKDEDSATEELEMYSIVFKDGDADTKYLSRIPTQYERLFMLVNGAIEELISDATIEKLIEKYNLNKSDDENADVSYEYIVLKSTVTDAKNDLEVPKKEAWEEVADVVYEGEVNACLAPPSDWAKDSVIKATDLEILEPGKEYNFAKAITREEFCELIYNYCGNVLGMLATSDGKRFSDTNNPKIEVLAGMSIINGKTATEFAPDDALTREEAAVILQRMVNATVPVSVTEMWFEFDDISYISDWAMDAVQTMCNMNVMNGVGGNEFAPKEVYTTEQAIVTITRVYSAQTAEYRREDIGNEEPVGTIIGGADAPTEIVVTDTIEVDDFYVDEAIKLITESGRFAGDKDFISLYTTNDEMTEKILALSTVDFNKPKEIYYLSADREQIIANLEALGKAEGVDFSEMGDVWVEHILKKFNFSTLASLINASYGAENLAALTILTNSRGYIMPKDFKNNFALFVQYEGDYSAIVSFSKFGDGVISANMSFVKNGDKDNVFTRLYEITSAVGEEGIVAAKVK